MPTTKKRPIKATLILWVIGVVFILVVVFMAGMGTLTDSPIIPTNTPQSIATFTATQSPISSTPPAEIIDDKSIPMRLVSAGTFTMGRDGDDRSDPAHVIHLESFYMDKFEVTNAHYAECVKAGVCDLPHETKSDFRPIYYGDPEYDNFPVMHVDWGMARTYCETWRGMRLPTEAEWEKAARGTDGRSYPWGEGIGCDRANFDGDPDPFNFCVGDTSEAGSYESGQSPYGLYDMAGNLFEWTSSLYKPYPYDGTDGREDLARPGSRVIRGGSWSEGPNDQKAFYRSWIGPELSESAIGFRCASSAFP